MILIPFLKDDGVNGVMLLKNKMDVLYFFWDFPIISIGIYSD